MQNQDVVTDQARSVAYEAGTAAGTALAYLLMIMLVGAIMFSIICTFMAKSREAHS